MSNGLLVDLIASWIPDPSLYLDDQYVHGLDMLKIGSYNDQYGVQAGFPGGYYLGSNLLPDGGFYNSNPSPLIQDMGSSDFMAVMWICKQDTTDYVTWSIGGNNGSLSMNGAFAGTSQVEGGSTNAFGGFYDGTNSEVDLSNLDSLTIEIPHMIACWYTNSDNTLHISVDAGSPVTYINHNGIGTSDPNNFFSNYIETGVGGGLTQAGPCSLWIGSEGVANAVSQLNNLFSNKLQFQDFDDVIAPSSLIIVTISSSGDNIKLSGGTG